MPYARLLKACKKTIGSKQTLKAIERGQAKTVYVAENADKHILDPILQACAGKGVPVVKVESMKELGKACGIDVGCASVAITEE